MHKGINGIINPSKPFIAICSCNSYNFCFKEEIIPSDETLEIMCTS